MLGCAYAAAVSKGASGVGSTPGWQLWMMGLLWVSGSCGCLWRSRAGGLAAPLCNSSSWPEAVDQLLLPPSRLITCMPACMRRPLSETSMAAAGIHTLTAPSLTLGAPALHNEKFVVSAFAVGSIPSVSGSNVCSALCTHAQPVIAQLLGVAKQAPRKPPNSTKNAALTTCPVPCLQWTMTDVESTTLYLYRQVIMADPARHTGRDKRAALRALLQLWAAGHPSPK